MILISCFWIYLSTNISFPQKNTKTHTTLINIHQNTCFKTPSQKFKKTEHLFQRHLRQKSCHDFPSQRNFVGTQVLPSSTYRQQLQCSFRTWGNGHGAVQRRFIVQTHGLVGKGGVDMLDFGGWKLRVEVFFEVPFWFLWGRFFACVFCKCTNRLKWKNGWISTSDLWNTHLPQTFALAESKVFHADYLSSEM